MKPRVVSVLLAVADLEAAVAFYRDGLGLPTDGIVATSDVEGDDGRIALFDMGGGQVLSVYARRDLARDLGVAETPADPLGFSLMYTAGSPDEVDAMLQAAGDAGGAIAAAASDRGGVYSGHFRDLDGHLWEVLVPLAA